MKIKKLEVENFRLLKRFSMDLEKELSLVIGKNNTGKTSILSVLDKFLNEKAKFTYDDFNIDFKKELEDLIKLSDPPEDFSAKGLKLKIFIEYDDEDDLSNVSRVLMDLDPDNNNIVLGFEYVLTYSKYLELRTDYNSFAVEEKKKVEGGTKTIARDIKNFLKQRLNRYFTIRKLSFDYVLARNEVNEEKYIDLVEQKISISDIISFKHIPARRDVTNKDRDNTLSRQTSSLYNKNEDSEEKVQATEDFIDQLSETDLKLSSIYSDLFKDVVKNVSTFGGVKLNETTIDIISTLQHRDLLEGNTTVVYNHDIDKLPEQYNGLGYMNLISMIFEIEILRQEFKRKKDEKPSDINLLVIEEPEAHTHPQMQYVFIKNIKTLLAEGVEREDGINRPLQYIITTHSSHIVADSDFNDIKYLKSEDKNNVVSKNLIDLKKEYDTDPNQYQFLKQYLTISRAKIFFADKAVLIEGDTERILIPTFMRKVDIEEEERLKAEGKADDFLPLLSQNISTIEVGAYSQIFEKFIEFLGIKSLVLTDIDAIKVIKQNEKGQDVWGACPVNEGTKTSNSAINHFLKEITWNNLKALPVPDRTILVGSSNVCICYQQEEDNYHARSFEDAFIHINRAFIDGKKDEFRGLQNRKLFDDGANAYVLADSCIKKKTHFALDILYHSNESFSNWNIPEYIKNGLLWLKED
ncbi:ATP-dependent nuclease [Salinimicrobium sediminilitoris]|uniref:ATP-dependent nuclease n=1 Tax=Salinimicrobium sediminilitoris TaxID=2876715 RepID=UPI001E5D2A62|nr:ATP-dependent endonuclease [Salinimicrobium sediminilitoris]MCC8361106.1 ATP-dependent endonuclease [Salinimicrobium sediminilitoris]